ncbi:MAG: HD domain-containing phosphohydrolase [Hyphomicrobiales bacterium]
MYWAVADLNFNNVKAAFIAEDKLSALGVLAELSSDLSIELIVWEFIDAADLTAFDIVIVSLDLKHPSIASQLSDVLKTSQFTGQLIFATDKSSRVEVTQAHALGAVSTIARPINVTQLSKTLLDVTHINIQSEKEPIEFASDTCIKIADMMDAVTIAARRGGPLPLDEIHINCENVIASMRNGNMNTWLKAVRSHSSYTYRHVMIVTGFAALFATRFNMAQEDASKLTLGAMLHDIGKIFIPGKILHKPGKLTQHETEIVREHAVKGAELLEKDGSFDDELIMIVRNHHELLDGSGYPDGLRGDEIPDIVRIMTVVDIFCGLIEARSYKASLPMDTAYKMLRSMGSKLDQAIVRGFEPIAYDNASHEMIKKIRKTAA